MKLLDEYRRSRRRTVPWISGAHPPRVTRALARKCAAYGQVA